MQLNWGHKLTIGMIGFMLFIVLLVANMLRQRIDLVETDYYGRGMKYQSEINSREGAENLLKVTYNGSSLIIKPLSPDPCKGSIAFYRPSDQDLDFTIPFETQGNEAVIPLQALARGLWKIRISWNDAQGPHLLEQSITR